MNTDLHFDCPHCNHQYVDDWEFLPANEMHYFNCESCKKPFWLQNKECQACTEESVFVWTTQPTKTDTDALICGSCGTSYHQPGSDKDVDLAE